MSPAVLLDKESYEFLIFAVFCPPSIRFNNGIFFGEEEKYIEYLAVSLEHNILCEDATSDSSSSSGNVDFSNTD